MKDSEPISRTQAQAAVGLSNLTGAPARLRSQARKKRRAWGGSGSWLAQHGSPVTATVLAALLVSMVLGNWSTLFVVAVVGTAGVIVALGWPGLTGIPMGACAQAMSAVVGIAAALVSALTHNFASVAAVLGLGMICAAAITVFFGPVPVDHSHARVVEMPASLAGTSAPHGIQLSGHIGGQRIAQKNNQDTPFNTQDRRDIPSRMTNGGTAPASAATLLRRSVAHATRSSRRFAEAQHVGTLGMAANTMCAMVVTSTAACWVALIDSPAWAPLAVPAGVIVAAVVLGDQWGHSFRANSWGALAVAVIVGVAMTVLASVVGQGAQLPVVFGYTRLHLGPNVAAGLLGLVTGVVVACSVIAVDGLLGDHVRQSSRLGAAARGCVKFLVAAVPVYAMIRVGAL